MDTSILAPMDEIYLITKIREAMIPDTDMHSVTDKADQTKWMDLVEFPSSKSL